MRYQCVSTKIVKQPEIPLISTVINTQKENVVNMMMMTSSQTISAVSVEVEKQLLKHLKIGHGPRTVR